MAGYHVVLATLLLKYASKDNFISGKMFNGDSSAINGVKEEMVLNRTIYVGMPVLELTKLSMYDFHYNYILYYNSGKVTDIDSLLYEVRTVGVYKDLHGSFDRRGKKIGNHLIILIIQKTANSFWMTKGQWKV